MPRFGVNRILVKNKEYAAARLERLKQQRGRLSSEDFADHIHFLAQSVPRYKVRMELPGFQVQVFNTLEAYLKVKCTTKADLVRWFEGVLTDGASNPEWRFFWEVLNEFYRHQRDSIIQQFEELAASAPPEHLATG